MSNNINLINFTDLTLEEKKMVLLWRNHPTIKQWMYNSDDILLENHLNFIETLNECTDKLYFLVKRDDDYIGVVDFTNIDKESKSSEFGLYSNPFLKIAGIGRILEEISIAYAFQTLKVSILKLEVFAENEKAINLYKKFNFKEITKKIVNNREVICMELNKFS
ncbi:UDP-4-amino-4,6-dideoxy-N-acetyl-beta-L-altrosamine N-acetyltransferase [Sulfurimonas sp.]|uniref:UDP-4-amino-4, 6-dideoxy-N-acetyl-beta-L-altrosamine N-acetyltransferase n=1 Tax=Sulfurimonas sp. TaxID=2022749 RepID=UPI0019DBCDD5|nr:UDP-4-amino-4,6-dideoxy-N-acetyl-beta-L-altrosamine N-acetyltransferase [Sulfurimonas sp.]MBE0514915.1 UDP-4-amino-4,6-dideoxy-N-acetyl-beta-L-altrosamine N-acetyltransferase [Sulfurimonas sp.]